MEFKYNTCNRFVDSYEAIHRTVEEMKALTAIEMYTRRGTWPDIQYLYNSSTKAAVMLKTVVYTTQAHSSSGTRHQSKSDKQKDRYKMNITDMTGHRAVTHFFDKKEFQGFTLVVPCGNRVHECCIFFEQMDVGKLEAIFFNPNFSVHTLGIQTNNVAVNFLKKFGNNLLKIHSYHIETCNVDGNCVGYVWKEIFNMLMKNFSPFTTSGVPRVPFNRYMTETSLKRKRRDFSKKIMDWPSLNCGPIWTKNFHRRLRKI